MLGFYNVSVILTYFGLASAVAGISLASGGHAAAAIACLMLCGVCDMFDGRIARSVSRSADAASYGVQIDSLCDLVSFGVLPAAIALSLGVSGLLGTAVLVVYVLGAVIRLGFFNVMALKDERHSQEGSSFFRGLPVTTAAWLVPFFYVLGRLLFPEGLATGLGLWLLVLALGFVLDFRLKKPRSLRVYVTGGLLLLAAAAAILFWL